MKNERLEIADLLRATTRRLTRLVGLKCGVTASLPANALDQAKRAIGHIGRAIDVMQGDPAAQIEETIFYAESVYGRKSRRGLVRLSFGLIFDETISLDAARAFAVLILEAATAAETDEILLEYFSRNFGADDLALSKILADFRKMRESLQARKDDEKDNETK